ncbi:F-box/LRR-repeat protein At3g26922-like [Nicotiana tabacum]|uniref:F-box/LRR-repeat protein At3g26922-like n=1 Tax=Nicotiana tabacum TaxID=4097 RepID=A0AC58UIX7_TOBAC
MEMERKVKARGVRLSDLPDGILLHILSMLWWDCKAVVRTSVLSQRWRFLWKSVPVSLDFESPNSYSEKDFIASTNRELYYWRSCQKIRRFRGSLFSAVLCSNFDYIVDEERNSEAENGYLKELLHSVANVEDLELGPWGIECLSILELKGWQSSPSSRKYLKLDTALEQSDVLGICSFLQSSPDLETLVIDWYNKKRRDLLSRYTNEDERIKRFKTHNYNCSLLHLKTIKIIDYDGPLSGNKSVLPLIEYLLKNATALEKFIIAAKFDGSDVSQDYVKMAQEFQSFPRSSPHAELSFRIDNL